jgi:hypothetical protein
VAKAKVLPHPRLCGAYDLALLEANYGKKLWTKKEKKLKVANAIDRGNGLVRFDGCIPFRVRGWIKGALGHRN